MLRSEVSTVPVVSVEETAGRPLRGQMGTASVVFMTIACMSPLTAAAGYVSLVIANGNGLGAPLMYIVVGAAVAVFAVGYLAMVRDVARPGGLYAYITSGLGKRVGLGAAFVSSVTYLLAQVGLSLFGGITLSSTISGVFNGPEVSWYWCTVPFIVISAILAYFNIGLSAKILGVILVVELVIVFVFDTAIFLRSDPGTIVDASSSFTLSALLSGSVPLAFLFCLSQFSGFESPALYYEEVKSPPRTVTRATSAVLVVIVGTYCVTAAMMIVGFGPDVAVAAIAADSSSAFSTLFVQYLGKTFYDVTAVLILTGILASVLGGNNVLSRYLYSLGVDGVLPRPLGLANVRTGAPTTASIAVSVALATVVAAVALTGHDPNELLALTSGTATFGFLALFMLASVAVLFYFWRKRDMPPIARLVLTALPVVSACVFATVLAYVSGNLSVLVGDSPEFGVVLQIFVYSAFAGGVLYASYLAYRRPRIFSKIGRETL